jgi:hypothetical protein
MKHMASIIKVSVNLLFSANTVRLNASAPFPGSALCVCYQHKAQMEEGFLCVVHIRPDAGKMLPF